MMAVPVVLASNGHDVDVTNLQSCSPLMPPTSIRRPNCHKSTWYQRTVSAFSYASRVNCHRPSLSRSSCTGSRHGTESSLGNQQVGDHFTGTRCFRSANQFNTTLMEG